VHSEVKKEAGEVISKGEAAAGAAGASPSTSPETGTAKPETAENASSAKDPNSQKMDKIKADIDKEKQERLKLIDDIRRLRYRLEYKKAEHEAILKLVSMKKEQPKNIGYLKRLKEKLEFKISTEALTLDSERSLVKKIGDIDKELSEAIKERRTERKADLLAKDIEELTKSIEEKENMIKEENKKLDKLYDSLRELRGSRQRQAPRERNRKVQQVNNISLGDIALVKNSKEAKEREEDVSNN